MKQAIAKDTIAFLAEASKILSSSLDYNVTLASIANLVVSAIADFCVIDLLQNDGRMHRVAVKGADYRKQKIAKIMFKFPPDPRNREAIYDAARRARPILIKKVTKKWLENSSRIPEEHEVMEKLGLHSLSIIFAPLKSRGRVIGVLTLVLNRKNFFYSEADVLLAEELANRAGVAVDNARLYTEAQDALRARDEFLSIASHELKTPLTSILLQLQTVLQNIRQHATKYTETDQYTVKIIEMLESTEQQSRRLAKLISDLLNVSLVSTGRLQLEKERVDLTGIVKDVLTNFSMQFKRNKTKVIFKNSTKPLIGIWDKVRLEQVISNLVSNAIKYGRQKPITISVKNDNKCGVFTIKDRGIGIKKEDQARIFERFKRGVSTSDYRGLGVGLYISRQIVDAHGGKIELRSKEGKGATFTVCLPLRS